MMPALQAPRAERATVHPAGLGVSRQGPAEPRPPPQPVAQGHEVTSSAREQPCHFEYHGLQVPPHASPCELTVPPTKSGAPRQCPVQLHQRHAPAACYRSSGEASLRCQHRTATEQRQCVSPRAANLQSQPVQLCRRPRLPVPALRSELQLWLRRVASSRRHERQATQELAQRLPMHSWHVAWRECRLKPFLRPVARLAVERQVPRRAPRHQLLQTPVFQHDEQGTGRGAMPRPAPLRAAAPHAF